MYKYINKIICGDAKEILKKLDSNSIDLTVTSPPYDELRNYEGYNFDFKGIANELYRVTKKGGVIVWVIGDQTIDGSETGTSFRHALYFKKIGFDLETMIWEKTGWGAFGSTNCYLQNFEYMFRLSKGKIKTFNPIKDRRNVSKPKTMTTSGSRGKDGRAKNKRKIKTKLFGKRYNIWKIAPENSIDFHPAPFPEKLVRDHIISWSNEGDIVLDPFVGSGTTPKSAMILKRKFIGIDISEKYCKKANERLNTVHIGNMEI